MPLVEALQAHVFAAERLHADDTPVPVLDSGQTRTGRLWTYVRDDRPFAGRAPPAAVYYYSDYYSPDRSGTHPKGHLASWAGLLQADAYAGFNRLYEPKRQPGPIIEAACWAHARRKFFDLARLTKAPIAIEAVSRIDALFAIERDINGLSPEVRHRMRQRRSRPLVEALGGWLREQYARLSPNSQVAKAIAYSLNSWDALLRFLDEGRLCLSNNAAERGMGMRASQQEGVQRAPPVDVVGVGSLAGEEAPVLLAPDRCTNAVDAHGSSPRSVAKEPCDLRAKSGSSRAPGGEVHELFVAAQITSS
jgi:transposase